MLITEPRAPKVPSETAPTTSKAVLPASRLCVCVMLTFYELKRFLQVTKGRPRVAHSGLFVPWFPDTETAFLWVNFVSAEEGGTGCDEVSHLAGEGAACTPPRLGLAPDGPSSAASGRQGASGDGPRRRWQGREGPRDGGRAKEVLVGGVDLESPAVTRRCPGDLALGLPRLLFPQDCFSRALSRLQCSASFHKGFSPRSLTSRWLSGATGLSLTSRVDLQVYGARS